MFFTEKVTMTMKDEENELDEGLEDDSFDNPALESELDAELIEEWCPVCRAIRPHAVVKDDKIACAECNHEHFREVEAKGTPVQTSILSAADEADEASLRAAWERLTTGEDVDIKAYSIRLQLKEGDVIKHTKFGIGVVVEMTDSTKAEVLFEDGKRRLVCGK